MVEGTFAVPSPLDNYKYIKNFGILQVVILHKISKQKLCNLPIDKKNGACRRFTRHQMKKVTAFMR